LWGKDEAVKFRCEREILADALATAGRGATNSTGTSPVLSGVRLDVSDDELVVTGTDLELTIRAAVPVAVERPGSAVVPARLVADIVKSLPSGSVEMSLQGEQLSISAQRSQFAVRPMALDDFPTIGQPASEPFVLSASAMSDALRQVVRAASTDEGRQQLTGVLIAAEEDAVRMVATDSYRLAVRDIDAGSLLRTGQQVLVPARALNEVQRLLGGATDLKVYLGERDAVFEVGEVRLTTRLIAAEYPNYRNLLPQSYPNVLTVGRDDLLDALRRVRLLAQGSAPVRLILGAGQLQLSAITTDVGEASEQLDAAYHGQDMTVAFNPDYLAAGVDAVQGDEVRLAVVDPMKPAVLRGVGHDEYLYLLMPVRVP
jgi:DNA polymerase-3 subunit beta